MQFRKWRETACSLRTGTDGFYSKLHLSVVSRHVLTQRVRAPVVGVTREGQTYSKQWRERRIAEKKMAGTRYVKKTKEQHQGFQRGPPP